MERTAACGFTLISGSLGPATRCAPSGSSFVNRAGRPRPCRWKSTITAKSAGPEGCKVRYWCYLLAVGVGCVLPRGAFAQGRNAATLARIIADWQERQGLLKTARYVITGTTEYKEKA